MSNNTSLTKTTWTHTPKSAGILNPFQIAGDQIIGVNQGNIYAFDSYTGQPTFNPIRLQNADDNLICYSGGYLYYIDGTTLKSINLFDGSAHPSWPAIEVDNPKELIAKNNLVCIVLGSKQNPFSSDKGKDTLKAFDWESGKEVWSVEYALSGTAGVIALGEDALFFADSSTLNAINFYRGDQRFPKPNSPSLSLSLSGSQLPLVGKKTVACVGGTNKIYGFDIEDGSIKWTYDGNAQSNWQASLSEDQQFVIAVNGEGQVHALAIDTGELKWSLTGEQAIPPELVGKPTIAGPYAYFTIDGKSKAAIVDLVSKTLAGTFDLSNIIDASSMSGKPIVDNGNLFLQSKDTKIICTPYGDQYAAYFNGQNSSIEITADAQQFDFGTGDFSIETWLRSSVGGEILSSYGEDSNVDHCRFRWNMSPIGQLRFGIFNSTNSNVDQFVSQASVASDGFWHHVAVVREKETVTFYLDGYALKNKNQFDRNHRPVYANGQPYNADSSPFNSRLKLSPTAPPTALNISGQKGLTIGAIKDEGQPTEVFRGMMQQLRLWKTALSADSIESKMYKKLGPLGDDSKARDPKMLGNWHMDDPELSLKNDVERHEFPAQPNNVKARITGLKLDDTAFPYLLHPEKINWPFSEHWACRGENAISKPAVATTNNIICFGTSDTIYGVSSVDGKRMWDLDVPQFSSAPVAFLSSIYVATPNLGICRITASTGKHEYLAELNKNFSLASTTPLTQPAISLGYIAVATPNGQLAIQNRQTKTLLKATTAANPSQLKIWGKEVFCIANNQLFIIDANSGITKTVTVDSGSVYHVDDERIFCIQNGQLTAFKKEDLSPLPFKTAAELNGVTITGLEADHNFNRLLATTSTGVVYGFTYGNLATAWKTPIPKADNHALYAPVLQGLNLYCSSNDRQVAVLDIRTGEIRSWFEVKNPIISAPLPTKGTIYVGCKDGGPTEQLDGGLHSIIIGECYGLHVGLDPTGNKDTTDGYVLVDQPSITDQAEIDNMQELTAQNCCVETWINLNSLPDQTSTIFHWQPSTLNQFGVKVYLDQQGKVHYVGYFQEQGTWKYFHALTETAKVHIEEWCHIAVSVNSQTDVRIYFDGVAQDVIYDNTNITIPEAVGGVKALIGADKEGQGATFFRGIIGEVRLWDVALLASEISHRMHLKLRGTEAALAAYWNFDLLKVHDRGPSQLGGDLKGDGVLWLTDLNFDFPTYPYLSSKASRYIPDTNSDPNNTYFNLTLTTHRSDGSPLANQALEVWYVLHPNEQGPNTIVVQEKIGTSKTLTAVKPHESNDLAQCFKVTTDASGEAQLQVITTDENHGPSLDVHAPFIAAKERFHISTLINSQKLNKPVPPKLIVQNKAMQEYNYASGGKIDHTNSYATYQTIIIAENADKTHRPFEKIKLRADQDITIKIDDQTYRINEKNASPLLECDGNGELKFVTEAASLNGAHIYVWAGFMHRNDHISVGFENDVHNKMGNITSDQMGKPQKTNWRTDKDGGWKKDTMLGKDYQEHAEKISAAVRHTMSAGKNQHPRPAQTQPATGMAAAAMTHYAKQQEAVMRQDEGIPRDDVISTLRTLRHIQREAPITPEYVLDSIQAASGKSDDVGFSFDFGDGKNPTLTYFQEENAHQYMGTPSPSTTIGGIPSGGPFSWVDDIGDGIKDAFNAVKSIAIKVGKAVTVAIKWVGDEVEKIAHIVINGIKQAVEIVVGFLEKIALKIIEVIKFLIELFDWGEILKAHKVFKELILACSDRMCQQFESKDWIEGAIKNILHKPPSSNSDDKNGIGNKTIADLRAEHANKGNQKGIQATQGVKGKSMYNKAKNKTDGKVPTPTFEGVPNSTADPSQQQQQQVTSLAKYSANMKSAPLGKTAKQVNQSAGDELLDLLLQPLNDGAKTIHIILEELLGKAADNHQSGILTHSLDIPFLSALYEWITGEELSILDVVCLVLAIPLNIVYYIMTGGRELGDDLKSIPNKISPSQKTGLADGLLSGSTTDQLVGVETIYAVVKAINILAQAAADAITVFNTSDEVSTPEEKRIFWALGALTASVTSILDFTIYNPSRVNWVAEEKKGIDGFDRKEYISSRFAVALSSFAVSSLAISMQTTNAVKPKVLGKAGLIGSIAVSLGNGAFLVYNIEQFVAGTFKFMDVSNDGLKKFGIIGTSASMVSSLTPISAPLFTVPGSELIVGLSGGPAKGAVVLTAVGAFRALASFSSLVLHVAATGVAGTHLPAIASWGELKPDLV